jgi:hypothetical protein
MSVMRAWLIGGVVWLMFVAPVAIVGRENMSRPLLVALVWLGIFIPGGIVFAIEHAAEFRRRQR